MFKLSGIDDFKQNLKLISTRYTQRRVRAIYEEAEDTMAVSKEKYAPRKTGHLRSTGVVHEPEVKRDRVVVKMSYWAAYAWYVHEAPESYNFKIGGRKFLEIPLYERLVGMQKRLAEKLNIEKMIG